MIAVRPQIRYGSVLYTGKVYPGELCTRNWVCPRSLGSLSSPIVFTKTDATSEWLSLRLLMLNSPLISAITGVTSDVPVTELWVNTPVVYTST